MFVEIMLAMILSARTAYVNSVCCCTDNSLHVINSGDLLSAERSWGWLWFGEREVSGAWEWPFDISQRLPAVEEKQV